MNIAKGPIWVMQDSTRSSRISKDESISPSKPLPIWVTRLPTISYDKKVNLIMPLDTKRYNHVVYNISM